MYAAMAAYGNPVNVTSIFNGTGTSINSASDQRYELTNFVLTAAPFTVQFDNWTTVAASDFVFSYSEYDGWPTIKDKNVNNYFASNSNTSRLRTFSHYTRLRDDFKGLGADTLQFLSLNADLNQGAIPANYSSIRYALKQIVVNFGVECRRTATGNEVPDCYYQSKT